MTGPHCSDPVLGENLLGRAAGVATPIAGMPESVQREHAQALRRRWSAEAELAGDLAAEACVRTMNAARFGHVSAALAVLPEWRRAEADYVHATIAATADDDAVLDVIVTVEQAMRRRAASLGYRIPGRDLGANELARMRKPDVPVSPARVKRRRG